MVNLANFEVFTNRTARPRGCTLTIGTRGDFAISGAAYEQLGKPAAVELLYDRTEQIIGLRPASADSPNSYTVRAFASGNSFAISGRAFARYYCIPLDRTVRRNASIEDGVLCISLKDPGMPVTSNRATARSVDAPSAGPG